MSVFDPLVKEKKKPSIDEIYGYEPEQEQAEEDNRNFLDKIIDDMKKKEETALNKVKEVR